MIVVAIIGILAAIAIPAYSNYQAKSKLTAGLAEISSGKTAVEDKINNGETVASATAIGLQGTTKNCTITTTGFSGTDASRGTGTIVCAVLNAPSQANGAVLTWSRTGATGAWACATTGLDSANKDLAPKNCPQS